MSWPHRTLFLAVLVPPLVVFYFIYVLQLHILVPAFTDGRSASQLLLKIFFFVFKPPLGGSSQLSPVNLGEPVPFVRHIVAVGDLHGDLPNARRVLQFSGVVDDFGNWTGHADYFVQTGDIIDR